MIQQHVVEGTGKDQSSQLEDTVGACKEAGGGVVQLTGRVGLIRDFDIPESVQVLGQGVQATELEWLGGDVEEAVVTSNLYDQHGFARGCGLGELTVRAHGQPGVHWAAPNECSYVRNVDVVGPTGFGFRVGPSSTGRQAHQLNVQGLKLAMLPSATTLAAIVLTKLRRSVWANTTVDVVPGAPGPAPLGLLMTTLCNQNTMLATHLENTSGVYLAAEGPCDDNYLVLDFNNPEKLPEPTTFMGRWGTYGVMVGPKGRSYTLRISDRHGLAWVLADASKDVRIPGKAGSITKVGPIVSARDTRNQPYVLSPGYTMLAGDFYPPQYNHAQRPAPGEPGRVIYNTTSRRPEYDNGLAWVSMGAPGGGA